MVLVDTSVWIDHFRAATSPECGWLADAITDNVDLCTCGVVLTEILQGIQSDRQCKEVRRLFDSLLYLPMSKEDHICAANIYRAARAKGKTIRNTADCLIAACAIGNAIPLLQKDKDFLTIEQVSDLEIVRC